jgi:hypothetical protein
MEKLLQTIAWQLLFVSPIISAVIWMRARRRAYEREADEPFSDLPLRLPGESTQKAAEEHWERGMNWFEAMALFSGLSGLYVGLAPPEQRLSHAIVLGGINLVVAAIATPRVAKSLRQYWNHKLGFRGERFVAEELNQLLAYGWRVFHDVPFDGYNVDHVVVGPSGVFAVETKTRRKWKAHATAHAAHIVKWDGRQLTWPSGSKNDFGLEQARRNARSTAEFISKACGESITCQPVLTLPGWWVEMVGRGDVVVASTKGLHKVLQKLGNTPTSAELIQRIAYQLEQRCKPVQGN